MATKKVYVGGLGPYVYDDEFQYTDSGEQYAGVRAEGQIIVESAPTLPNHVVRLADLQLVDVTLVQVASISNPVELNDYAGGSGKLLYVFQSQAGVNYVTLYVWDAGVIGGLGTPYEVSAKTSGKWLAIGGRYNSQACYHGTNPLFAGETRITGAAYVSGQVSATTGTFGAGVAANTSRSESSSFFGTSADAHAVTVDATNNKLTVSANTDFEALNDALVGNDLTVNGAATLNSERLTNKVIVRNQTAGDLVYIDPATGRVGINSSNPAVTLDVSGVIQSGDKIISQKGMQINTLQGANSVLVYKDSTYVSDEETVLTVDPNTAKVGILCDEPTHTLTVGGYVRFQQNAYIGGKTEVNDLGSAANYFLVKRSGGTIGFKVNGLGETGILTDPVSGWALTTNGDAWVIGKLSVDTNLYTGQGAFIDRNLSVNLEKGSYDFIVHGNGLDNVIKSEGSSNKLYFNPTALEVSSPSKFTSNSITLSNLPTSAVGLTSGMLYNDAGTIKIVA